MESPRRRILRAVVRLTAVPNCSLMAVRMVRAWSGATQPPYRWRTQARISSVTFARYLVKTLLLAGARRAAALSFWSNCLSSSCWQRFVARAITHRGLLSSAATTGREQPPPTRSRICRWSLPTRGVKYDGLLGGAAVARGPIVCCILSAGVSEGQYCRGQGSLSPDRAAPSLVVAAAGGREPRFSSYLSFPARLM